ncbi:MAG: hypothetical protein P9X24_15475 [Candidatus Hatepunaea meridiana]|nr:hypothetical protein [Candidatus Hatepunaea meridiana]
MKTDTEIRVTGLEVLIQALGIVEAERFIALMLREPFDYTEWHKDLWPGRSIEAISKAAMALQKGSTNQDS